MLTPRLLVLKGEPETFHRTSIRLLLQQLEIALVFLSGAAGHGVGWESVWKKACPAGVRRYLWRELVGLSGIVISR